jgi:hypothetical protein
MSWKCDDAVSLTPSSLNVSIDVKGVCIVSHGPCAVAAKYKPRITVVLCQIVVVWVILM